jgi:hypothetical protein
MENQLVPKMDNVIAEVSHKPISTTYPNLQTDESIPYYVAFSNFSLALIPPNILLKTFISKAANRLLFSIPFC